MKLDRTVKGKTKREQKSIAGNLAEAEAHLSADQVAQTRDNSNRLEVSTGRDRDLSFQRLEIQATNDLRKGSVS